MDKSKSTTESYRHLPRRRFSREFKRQVVEQLLNSRLTVAEVAREHELHPNQLCRWRNEYRHHAVSMPAAMQVPELLPVTLAPEPQASAATEPVMPADTIGLRITLARGQVHVFNGCAPEVLRVAIEALQ